METQATEGKNEEGCSSDKPVSPVSSVSPSEKITVSPVQHPIVRRSSIIDAETANCALKIRAMGRQFDNYGGQTAEQFLEALGI